MKTNWQSLVERWKKSGMNLTAFAAEQGVAASSLDYHVKKATKGPNPYRRAKARRNGNAHKLPRAASAFVQLNGHAPQIEIQTATATIKVPTSISTEELKNILKAIEQ